MSVWSGNPHAKDNRNELIPDLLAGQGSFPLDNGNVQSLNSGDQWRFPERRKEEKEKKLFILPSIGCPMFELRKKKNTYDFTGVYPNQYHNMHNRTFLYIFQRAEPLPIILSELVSKTAPNIGIS